MYLNIYYVKLTIFTNVEASYEAENSYSDEVGGIWRRKWSRRE